MIKNPLECLIGITSKRKEKSMKMTKKKSMKMTKKKSMNSYTISGLTLGKIIAIQRALTDIAEFRQLGSVGNEVKIFLDDQLANNPICQTKNM
jgi:hypothetical protein